MPIIVEYSPEILLALTLGAARLDAHAAMLATCPRCHDRPERHLRAAEQLRKLATQLAEDEA